jgi:hypothetical protein
MSAIQISQRSQQRCHRASYTSTIKVQSLNKYNASAVRAGTATATKLLWNRWLKGDVKLPGVIGDGNENPTAKNNNKNDA